MKGANICYGLQEYVHELTTAFIGRTKGIRGINNVIYSKSAMQLALDHRGGRYDEYPRCSPLRRQFMANLDGVGYPQNTRNVVVVSGSNNAQTNPYMNPEDWIIHTWRYGPLLASANHWVYTQSNTSLHKVLKMYDGVVLQFLTGLPFTKTVESYPFKSSYSLDCMQGSNFGNGGNSTAYKEAGFWGKLGLVALFHGKVKYDTRTTFIPSVSAIDYANDDWSLDFKTTANDLVCNNLTPFEKIYSQSYNERHVQDFENPQKIAWFWTEIRGGLHKDLPYGKTYNFGDAPKSFDLGGVTSDVITLHTLEDIYKTVTVHGVLKVNNDLETDYLVDPKPVASSKFEVNVGSCRRTGVELKIEGTGSSNLAELYVGEYPNIGKIYVHNECVLRLGVYSKCKVTNSSQIIVKKGGKLIVEAGAAIELNGDNAMIIIEDGGLLEIGDNAIFTFTGSGRMKFIKNISYDANGKMTYPTNIKAGSNSQFKLLGASEDDVVLEVTGEEYVMPDKTLVLFSLKKGQVSIGKNCRLVIGCPLYLEDVRITSTNNNTNDPLHRGLQIFGQAKVTIKNTTIRYGETGLYAALYQGGNKLTVESLTVQNCITGIYSKGCGIDFNGAKMHNCKTGWQADESYFDSKATGLEAYAQNITNSKGIEFRSWGASSLRILDSYIYSFRTDGVQYLSGPSLSVKCSHIYNNIYGNGIAFNGGVLNLSSAVSPSSGNNTIINNIHALNIHYCDNLLLENGKNILWSKGGSNSIPMVDIVATTSNYYYFLGYIPATNNKWGPSTYIGVADVVCNSNSISTPLVDINPIAIPSMCLPVHDNTPFNGSYVTGDCDFSSWHNNPTVPVWNPNNIMYISTNSFNNVQLHLAMNKALTDLYVDTNYDLAISEFSEILGYSYPTTIGSPCNAGSVVASVDGGGNPVPPTCMDVENVELLKLAYSKMMEALGTGLSSGSIIVTRGQSAPTSVTTVLSTISDLISDLGSASTKTYPSRLVYTFDQAFIYRLAENRTDALNTLSSMTWADSADALWVDYYTCSFAKEDSSIMGSIPIAAIYTKLAECPKPVQDDITGNYAPVVSKLIGETNNARPIVNTLRIFPNPTDRDVQFNASLENDGMIRMTLMDMAGKQLYINTIQGTKGTNIYSLNLPVLSNGMYLLKMKVNGKNYMERLFIKH